MIRLPQMALPRETVKGLRLFQQELDQLPTYAERVAAADRLFASRNRPRNKVFRVVRQRLAAMCGGTNRCCYCEDSCADEVEHHRPKNFYPDYTFVWENYLYACGPCNGPKRNQFAIFETATGNRVDLFHPKGKAPTAPPPGDPLLIDPRSEDPLDFMILDLCGTFLFNPTAAQGTRDFRRAKYTIDVLQLNRRTFLPIARVVAFGSYRSALYEYREKKNRGDAPAVLTRLTEGLRQLPHRTVWAEMKRQHPQHRELAGLFAELPEALTW